MFRRVSSPRLELADGQGADARYVHSLMHVKPDLPNLQAPVLGLYAERDGFVTPDSVHELEQKLKELGKPAEMHIYPEVDHGFFNDERPTVYNEAAAKDAWKRVIDFFSTHLK